MKCKRIQGIAKEYKGVKENTGVCKGIQGNAKEYKDAQKNTREYMYIKKEPGTHSM